MSVIGMLSVIDDDNLFKYGMALMMIKNTRIDKIIFKSNSIQMYLSGWREKSVFLHQNEALGSQYAFLACLKWWERHHADYKHTLETKDLRLFID